MKDIIKSMKASSKKIIIFYGSQTGTAESFAHRFAKNLQSYNTLHHHLNSVVIDPEELDIVINSNLI